MRSQRDRLALAAGVIVLGLIVQRPCFAQTFTVLYEFTGNAGGQYPAGTIAIDQGGNLYGAAGVNVVYRLAHQASGWLWDPIYSFTGPPDGLAPNGVMIGPDGALYGTSWAGGIPDCYDGGGCGTVFRIHPGLTFCRTALCPWMDKILYDFTGLPPDGTYPGDPVVFDAQGRIYGIASFGGQYGNGMVYQLTPENGSWSETILYSFVGGSDGATPEGGLSFDSNGNLYGVTYYGGDPNCNGEAGCGTVFRLTNTGSGWSKTTLYVFHGAVDGAWPKGTPILDQAGNIYGTTSFAGLAHDGTVFELSNGTWNFTLLASLGGEIEGPVAALTMDSAGNLYGTTVGGGMYQAGAIFKLTHSNGSWAYTSLHDFTGGADGGYPMSNVLLDPSGNVYSTASEGGIVNCGNGCGLVFEITP